jgi:RecA-family ATPase
MTIQSHQQSQHDEQPQPFTFDFTDPYKTFEDGKPVTIPYVIDGLLTQGGFSVLGGKSKMGKSSLAATRPCASAKASRSLGVTQVQGEVILINLEDPMNHVDNCLTARGAMGLILAWLCL